MLQRKNIKLKEELHLVPGGLASCGQFKIEEDEVGSFGVRVNDIHKFQVSIDGIRQMRDAFDRILEHYEEV